MIFKKKISDKNKNIKLNLLQTDTKHDIDQYEM